MCEENTGNVFLLPQNVLKLGLFSVMAGVSVGAVCALFLSALDIARSFISSAGIPREALLFPALIFTFYFLRRFAPLAADKALNAPGFNVGSDDLKTLPAKLAAAVVTISAGGSAGRAGPCAHAGACLMYGVSKMLSVSEADSRRLVACGVSAGFSSAFGCPLSGALFGIEVMKLDMASCGVLFPSFVSGAIACRTVSFMGTSAIPGASLALPDPSFGNIGWAVLAGIFFGLISRVHIKIFKVLASKLGSLKVRGIFKPLIGASLLAVLAGIFGDSFLGLGMETIEGIINGGYAQPLLFALKSAATAVTLSCGGYGGIVMPTIFTGAAAGSLFARLTGLDAAFCGALGMAGVLAGSAGAPIAASMLAIELFGSRVAPFAGIACAASYLVAHGESIYSGRALISGTN
jgi:H+/Cl- antiporter ClcA